MLKQIGNIGETGGCKGNIFRITSMTKNDDNHRYPYFCYIENGDFHLFGTECDATTWNNYWNYKYHNPVPKNEEAAITMEYVRELNVMKF